MKAKFLSTVKKFNMFSRGDRVIVGLSGGADSMCLTSLLIQCRDELGITVEAAHINHCIRGEEADYDEAFVSKFCAQNNIILHSKRIDIPELASISGESIELCARKARYRFFEELNADKIATAHTGSDRIETMLFNLSRGSSLNGICSIPAVRGMIVRPLIEFTRADVEEYCEKNRISFVTDSSNLTDEYTRNKYRHNVIRELMNINSSFEKNALRCLDTINKDNSFLSDYVQDILEKAVDADGKLSIASLQGIDKRLFPRIISAYLSKACDSDFEMRHIDFILNNFNNAFSITLPGGHIVSGDNNRIFIKSDKALSENKFEPISFDVDLDSEVFFADKSVSVYISDASGVQGDNFYFADADKINGTLYLRTRCAGDVFHLGKRRCSKSLNKLFNESRISADKRDSILIIADDNGPVFVEGFGIDSLKEINSATKKFLIIKYKDGKND